MPAPDWTPDHEFEDGEGNVASGVQVMENFRSLRDWVLEAIQAEGTVRTLVLKSDSTAVQNLTTGYVTMKNVDGSDCSVTPEAGTEWEIFVSWACQVSEEAASRECDFEVRKGADVLAQSMPPMVEDQASDGDGGYGGGRIRAFRADEPIRASASCGTFEGDGEAVKFYVKASSAVETPQLLRKHTYVLLREITG